VSKISEMIKKNKAGQAMVEYAIIASSIGLCVGALWGLEIQGYTGVDVIIAAFTKLVSYLSFIISFP
jgi:hypothetical protein